MASSLFISYCRREAPFVDSLLGALEKRGFTIWLDYRTLVPGKPWKEQIYEGLVNTEVVLLIVSQESIASENVAWEWQQAIALNKRIILGIFEAVPLPPELQSCEWVDLRGEFRPAVRQLVKQLETPDQPDIAPPQEGSKMPWVVKYAIFLSTIVSLLSLLTGWTIYIPYFLLPLPYRIFKRDFNFFHVRNALMILPFASLWTLLLATTVIHSEQVGAIIFTSVTTLLLTPLLTALLLLCLHLPDMQRWGKPIASRPKFVNPYKPKIQAPEPISFTVDYSRADKRYADAIIHCLTKYGHHYIERDSIDVLSAQAVLVLISSFKQTTQFSLQAYRVYPILLQDTKAVDPDLHRIQWIDFRRGLRNLNHLAKLLPEPDRLLRALGIVPPSHQTVLPPIIQCIVCYLTVLASLISGIWSILLSSMGRDLPLGELILISLSFGMTLGITYSAIRSMTLRRGCLASLPGLLGVIVAVGMTILSSFLRVSEWVNLGSGALLACFLTFVVGLLLVALLAVLHFRALLRWFPHQAMLFSGINA